MFLLKRKDFPYIICLVRFHYIIPYLFRLIVIYSKWSIINLHCFFKHHFSSNDISIVKHSLHNYFEKSRKRSHLFVVFHFICYECPCLSLCNSCEREYIYMYMFKRVTIVHQLHPLIYFYRRREKEREQQTIRT